MATQQEDFSNKPSRICEDRWDLVWIILPEETNAHAFENLLLQHLDWRLVGQLSRWWKNEKSSGRTTFIPTLKRIPTPLVALSRGADAVKDELPKAVAGANLKRVLCVAESAGAQAAAKAALDKLKGDAIKTLEYIALAGTARPALGG